MRFEATRGIFAAAVRRSESGCARNHTFPRFSGGRCPKGGWGCVRRGRAGRDRGRPAPCACRHHPSFARRHRPSRRAPCSLNHPPPSALRAPPLKRGQVGGMSRRAGFSPPSSVDPTRLHKTAGATPDPRSPWPSQRRARVSGRAEKHAAAGNAFFRRGRSWLSKFRSRYRYSGWQRLPRSGTGHERAAGDGRWRRVTTMGVRCSTTRGRSNFIRVKLIVP